MAVVRSIGVAERRSRIGVHHHLAPKHRIDDVARIADDLVALHSSDPVTVYLSAAMRMRHPSLEPVSAALYDDRSLVRHHAMRRTLWVFTPEVARLAHAAATAGLIPPQHKTLLGLLEATGTFDDPEAWMHAAKADTLAALRRLGPSSSRQLGKAVPALTTKLRLSPGKAYASDVAAHTRLLLLLGFEGAIVRTRPTGTWINAEYTWAVAEDWIEGGVVGTDRAAAAAALADRWLRAFGPAPASDLQWWAGWSGKVTTAALADCGAVPVDLDGQPGWLTAADDERVRDPGPWVALLPSLDPTTMGWQRRDWYLTPEAKAAVFDRNGNGGHTIWADGEIVGTWVQRPDGEIATRLLVDIGAERTAAVESEAAVLRTLLGETRFKARFPAPMQAELLR